MTPDEEADIFTSGQTPEVETTAPEPDIAPSQESQAVSSAIRALDRRAPDEEPAPPPEPAPQPPQQQPQGDHSPAGLLRALLDERERRQDAMRQLQKYQEQEQEAKKNATPFDQRFFEKPQEELGSFVDQRLSPVQEELRDMRTDLSMKLAAVAVGPAAFNEAYRAWYEQVGDPSRPNPQLYWGVMNSGDPGQAILQWHNDVRERQEIGQEGLEAYKARLEREFMQKYGISAPGPNGGSPMSPQEQVAATSPRQPDGKFAPRHEVRLPTPTSRMGAAGRGHAMAADDGSEEAIFDSGRPEKRK